MKNNYKISKLMCLITVVIMMCFMCMTSENIYAIENNTKTENDIQYDKIQDFVKRMYTVVLGRDAESEGLAMWTNALIQGEYEGTSVTGASIAKMFIESKEFNDRNESDETYIDIMYNAIMNRTPDNDGEKVWLECLENGVSRIFVLNEFIGSIEYSNICNEYGIEKGTIELIESRDQNYEVTRFVQRCYKMILERNAEIEGLNTWCEAIVQGKVSPGQMAYDFVFSYECVSKKLDDSDFIDLIYNTYMGRECENIESKRVWLSYMQTHRRQELLKEFNDSKEFASIIDEYNLDSNNEIIINLQKDYEVQENYDYDITKGIDYYINKGYITVNSYEEAKELFKAVTKNMKSGVHIIGDYDVIEEAYMDLWTETNRYYTPDYVYYEDGYYHWLFGSAGIIYGDNNHIISFGNDKDVIDLYFAYDSTYEQEMQARQKVKDIARQFDYGSTYDKIKNVYDYLCSNVVYDYTLNNRTLYEALILQNTVCDGYSRAFKLIMDELGIPATIEAGAGHAWNSVMLDGNWYIIDTTNGASYKNNGHIIYFGDVFLGGINSFYAQYTLQPIGNRYSNIPNTYISLDDGSIIEVDADGHGVY